VNALFPRRDGVPARPHIGLAEVQLVLARELGYSSWTRLARHIDDPSSSQSTGVHSMTTANAQNTDTLELFAIDQIGLSCTDLDEAQRFYCDVLGLRYGGEAPPTMKFFDCAGVNIIMFKGEKVTPGSIIYFKVDGVPNLIQQKFQMLKDRGVKVEGEPRCIARNWNRHDVWLAFFYDPFGNMLALKSDVPVS
jgi:catechol 2,3-dioxygenase-like lactoylglutathione lyase family enzyme